MAGRDDLPMYPDHSAADHRRRPPPPRPHTAT